VKHNPQQPREVFGDEKMRGTPHAVGFSKRFASTYLVSTRDFIGDL
jgi:hypothetical protein